MNYRDVTILELSPGDLVVPEKDYGVPTWRMSMLLARTTPNRMSSYSAKSQPTVIAHWLVINKDGLTDIQSSVYFITSKFRKVCGSNMGELE